MPQLPSASVSIYLWQRIDGSVVEVAVSPSGGRAVRAVQGRVRAGGAGAHADGRCGGAGERAHAGGGRRCWSLLGASGFRLWKLGL